MQVLERVGLTDVAIVQRYDCFRGTSKERVARKFGVEGVCIVARRPL